jgi:hypothetical protein
MIMGFDWISAAIALGADFTLGAGEAYARDFCRRRGVGPLATEPTQAGLQYVMPGCEKDQTRGPSQMSLF